jgi:hypothetical protein
MSLDITTRYASNQQPGDSELLSISDHNSSFEKLTENPDTDSTSDSNSIRCASKKRSLDVDERVLANTAIIQSKKQLTGKQRTSLSLEQYYTKPAVAQMCVDIVANLDVPAFDLIIDPCAGTGVFIEPLKHHFPNSKLRCYDIDPKHDMIKHQDYLTSRKRRYPNYERVLFITNPPFGSHAKIAKKIIQKMVDGAKVGTIIALILPLSFDKPFESQTKVFPDHWHSLASHELPRNSFLVNGKDHDVNTVFQVWQKMSLPRHKEPIPVATLCTIKITKEIPVAGQVAIYQNGGKAGQAVLTEHTTSKGLYVIQSQFLAQREERARFCYVFNQTLIASSRLTSGRKSVGMNEIIPKIEQVITQISIK